MLGLPASQMNAGVITGDASGGERPSRPPRLLVTDHDPSMRHMLANYLTQHNIRVVCAPRKQEVLRHFGSSEPNLVILDLRLGHEDGLDLLREIRSRSDVPVIITMGHRRDEIDGVVGVTLRLTRV
jgi:two-component system OmpR family response regulator